MKRVARKHAGKQVSRLTRKYMRDARAAEEDTHAEIRALLAAEMPRLERLIREAYADGGPMAVLEDRARMRQFQLSAQRVLVASEEPYRWCMWRTGTLAADAARLELRWIERTMSKTFAGLTDETMAGVPWAVAELVEAKMSDYVMSEVAASVRWMEALRKQMYLAAEADDPVEVMLGRVLSPEPFRAAGISGRGVWWRISGTISPATTHAAVDVANRVFEGAMHSFNLLGEARRG